MIKKNNSDIQELRAHVIPNAYASSTTCYVESAKGVGYNGSMAVRT
jgi:hypothetical protein